jgi:hypothetical protein
MDQTASDIDMTLPEAYQLMDLPRAATYAQVRKKFLEMVLLHHPDRGGDAFIYRLIQHANQTICNAHKEFRRDERDGRWTSILDEMKQRRNADPELKSDEQTLLDTFSIDSFNKSFESKRNGLFEEPLELREARKQVLLGSTIGQEVSHFVLTEFKLPDDTLQLTTPLDGSRVNQTMIRGPTPCTDVLEAWNPPGDVPTEPTEAITSLEALLAVRAKDLQTYQEDQPRRAIDHRVETVVESEFSSLFEDQLKLTNVMDVLGEKLRL